MSNYKVYFIAIYSGVCNVNNLDEYANSQTYDSLDEAKSIPLREGLQKIIIEYEDTPQQQGRRGKIVSVSDYME